MAETFYLHNTTRSPHTVDRRRQLTSDQRSKKNLIIGGGTVSVRRGRPTPVAGALVRQHAGEIAQLVENGLLRVTNGRQQEIDVSTMQPLTGKAVPTAELKPVAEPEKAPKATKAAPEPAPEPEPVPEPEPEPEPAKEDEESSEETSDSSSSGGSSSGKSRRRRR